MKILKIEWKNFSSYGNKKQSLSFEGENGLYQIIGENGAGKSSISQVITFGLYGKIEGKKLSDIPNRINGHTEVIIEFESNGNVVRVERGLDPSYLNLYLNGVLYDQAGSRNIQDYLTDDLIGIPYYVFNNTISLSINDFKSFIKMSPQDKRAIVDKIFGFQILNRMRDFLKDESKKIKDRLEIISGNLESLNNSINKSNKEMESLLDEIESEAKEEINNLNEELNKFKNLQDIHKTHIESFKEDESSLYSLIKESNTVLMESKSSYQDLSRRLKLYESDKCPTCESSLDTEFHKSAKDSFLCERETHYDKIKETEDVLLDLKKSESEMKSRKNDLISKGAKIESRISFIIKELRKIQSKDSDKQIQALKRIIENMEKDRENFSSESFRTEEKSNWVRLLDDILGEKGVKQMAVKTILPSLNSEILDLMREMHLDYQIIFDEEFKASLHHMGIEIPIQTLSTGEMKKIDFVVLISIMKLMKLKFSSINLLFLDELFSSVDPDGVHSILKILQKSSRDMGLNIFVINHAPMPHEIFDWKLEVLKTNNFSSISLDKF
jgi:DNA repair exonuclease SbcCD ATPase subunit